MNFNVTIRHKENVDIAMKIADSYAKEFFGERIFVFDKCESSTVGNKSKFYNEYTLFDTTFYYLEIFCLGR